MHPLNQTAEYGFPVEFECRASGCDDTLKLLVNDVGWKHVLWNVDSRLYNITDSCNSATNELVVRLWMIVNHITLEAVHHVSCNLTVFVDQQPYDISSDRGYISNVTYPNSNCPVCEPSTVAETLPDISPECFGSPTSPYFNGCLRENLSLTLLIWCLSVSVWFFL